MTDFLTQRMVFRYSYDPSGTIFHGAIAQYLLAPQPKAVVLVADAFCRVRYDVIDVSFYPIWN